MRPTLWGVNCSHSPLLAMVSPATAAGASIKAPVEPVIFMLGNKQNGFCSTVALACTSLANPSPAPSSGSATWCMHASTARVACGNVVPLRTCSQTPKLTPPPHSTHSTPVSAWISRNLHRSPRQPPTHAAALNAQAVCTIAHASLRPTPGPPALPAFTIRTV